MEEGRNRGIDWNGEVGYEPLPYGENFFEQEPFARLKLDASLELNITPEASALLINYIGRRLSDYGYYTLRHIRRFVKRRVGSEGFEKAIIGKVPQVINNIGLNLVGYPGWFKYVSQKDRYIYREDGSFNLNRIPENVYELKKTRTYYEWSAKEGVSSDEYDTFLDGLALIRPRAT